MGIQLNTPEIRYIDSLTLNKTLETMIGNDNKLLPQSTIAPKIWCCRWYNRVISQMSNVEKSSTFYQAGDAVWLNTESVAEFTKYNYDYIESVVKSNGLLQNKLAECEGDEAAIFQLFTDIVTGAVTGNADSLPLYYLGDITQKVRIRVSLSNDNCYLPTNNVYWKDFFIDLSSNATEKILSSAAELADQYMRQHIDEYHLSGIEKYWYEHDGYVTGIDDHFAHVTLSNVTNVQEYVNTNTKTVNSGLDYVVKYYHRKFNGDRTCKWFRVWRSGLLEHGGIVAVDKSYASEMGDSLVYNNNEISEQYPNGRPTHYKVNLSWTDANLTAPSYKYATQINGFYSTDKQIDLGDGYPIQLEQISRSIDPANRYTVSISPVSDRAVPYSVMHPAVNNGSGIYYMSKEINSMTNDSFCFMLSPECGYYSYHVKGFVPNLQLGYI